MLKKLSILLGIFLILVSGAVSAEEVSNLKMNDTGMVYSSSAEEEEVMLVSTLAPLSTPTGLTWNVTEDGEPFQGRMCWNVVPNCEGSYFISVYRNGVEVFHTNWSGLYDHNGIGKVSVESISHSIFNQSGDYTFSIQAQGDGITYENSAVATSPVYHFECPSSKLQTPVISSFNNGILVHSAVKNASGYRYILYDQNKNEVGWTCFVWNSPMDNYGEPIYEDLGWYMKDICSWNNFDDITGFYVKVAAMTYNIELYQNSNDSSFSPLYHFSLSDFGGDEPSFVDDILGDVDAGYATATEALDAILEEMVNQDITNLDMALNMTNNESLVDSISRLEDLYCQENNTSVNISNNPEDTEYLEERGINADHISVIGAALNGIGGQDVDINFSKADDSLSQDSLFYKNSVAVNIDIDGVHDSKNLDIPIQITMPAPAGVLPDRMVILHYHVDGSIETIHPGLFYEDETPYLKFVLTSFSPFVFCNEVPPFAYDSSSNQVIVTSEVGVTEGTLLVGAYQNGILIDFESVSTTITANTSTPVSLTNFDSTGADEIRYFVWDDPSVLKPLLNSYSEKL
ncbi:MAG: hypothetical protein J6A56_01310 [Clostridia bacterium]|nr:hypothetical protein [Clostridia bacterium]